MTDSRLTVDAAAEVPEGYKRTEVGVIPEDWEIISLESLVPKGKKYGIVDGPFGSNLKSIHYKNKGIPIISSGYVTEGKFLAIDYIFVDVEKFKQEKRSAVRAGDIVMAKIGARCGSSAILPQGHPTGILSGNALKITVDEERYDSYFIWQVLWSLYTKGNLDDLRAVGAQPAISIANLKKYKIVTPSRQEQKSIAQALTDVDALLAALDKLITKKRNLKTATMQQLLTGQTRLPGFGKGKGYKETEVGVIPEDWEVHNFEDITSLITCGIAATPEYVPSGQGFPFLSSTNIKNSNIDWSEYKHISASLHRQLYINNPPNRGDILYSRVGTIGEAAIIES